MTTADIFTSNAHTNRWAGISSSLALSNQEPLRITSRDASVGIRAAQSTSSTAGIWTDTTGRRRYPEALNWSAVWRGWSGANPDWGLQARLPQGLDASQSRRGSQGACRCRVAA